LGALWKEADRVVNAPGLIVPVGYGRLGLSKDPAIHDLMGEFYSLACETWFEMVADVEN
jgi:hypothetical protein